MTTPVDLNKATLAAHPNTLLFSDRSGQLYLDRGNGWTSSIVRVVTSFLGFRNYNLEKITAICADALENDPKGNTSSNLKFIQKKYTYQLAKRYSIDQETTQLLIDLSAAKQADVFSKQVLDTLSNKPPISHQLKKFQKSSSFAHTKISKKAIETLFHYCRSMEKYQQYQNLETKISFLTQFLKKGIELEQQNKLSLQEFRDLEDLSYANETLSAINRFFPESNKRMQSIIRISQLSKKILKKISNRLGDQSKKSCLIAYPIKTANDYGRWKFPTIAQWISRNIYHSEIIHLALSVPQKGDYFVSDLSLNYRWNPLKVGDLLYERYSISWESLVLPEKRSTLKNLLGNNWKNELQNRFEKQLERLHKDRGEFSILKNTPFQIFKRMLTPRWFTPSQDQLLKLDGTMICSTFVERMLATALTQIEQQLIQSLPNHQGKIFSIPLSKNSSHNDLPPQMMRTWANVLTLNQTPGIFSKIIDLTK